MRKQPLTIKLDQSAKDQLAILAERHKRTVSDVTRLLLEYSLEKYQKAKHGSKAGVDLLRRLDISKQSTNEGR